MRFKKVYIEITNRCNLRCQFCIKNKRKVHDISRLEYHKIIEKIRPYTSEVYLHILGEPLLHDDINYYIDYAYDNGLKVNITTNGYLISKIMKTQHIHRLNISIHSFRESYGVSLTNYMDSIFKVVDLLKDKTFVSFRLWVNDKESREILRLINDKYNTNIKELAMDTKIKLDTNVIIDSFHEFIWPELDNNYYNTHGRCMGLIDHLGILSDGTIVPCCLDSKGIIKLGNIYDDEMDTILNSDIVKEMIDGFKKNYKCQELCRHCQFLNDKK